MNNIEIWKPVKDFEDLYEISNFGRLKTFHGNTYENGKLLFRYKILNPHICSTGYYRTRLSRNKYIKEVHIHRLVAEVFLEQLSSEQVVNHKDGNKLNNHVDNLEWCTQAENIRHAYKIGLKEGNKGEKNPVAILNPDQVLQISRMIDSGIEYKEIAYEFNVDEVTICDIKRGKTWAWLTGRIGYKPKNILTQEIVIEIYNLTKRRELSQKEIAKKYNISQGHVSEIKNGKYWTKIISAQNLNK